MYQLVMALGKSDNIDPDTCFPLPCLVQDDDGLLIVIVAEPRMSFVHISESSGAAAVIWRSVTATKWMPYSTFVSGNQRGDYIHAPDAWSDMSGAPNYRDLVAQPSDKPTVSTSGFVSLHVHSEFSAFDGFSKVQEIVDLAAEYEQPAVALTDHGTCAGHFTLQQAAEPAGVRPIFGIEAYFVSDRHDRSNAKDYQHLCLWATDDEGLRNLWSISTEGFREGFYGHPRIDLDTLSRYSQGVMCGTACLSGPVAQHLLDGDEELARHGMSKLLSVFGDRLYAELHTNSLDEQVVVNHRLVSLAQSMSVPLIAVTDAHYPTKAHADTHRTWVAMQTNNDVSDNTGLFSGKPDYYMMSEAEVRSALSYLPEGVVDEAVGNTVALAERSTARIKTSSSAPVYSKVGGVEKDSDRLVDLCLSQWGRRNLPNSKHPDYAKYAERFEKEMRLLISKKFCGYFLMVADYTKWAKDNGILVGPGRGSGGGSLVAYLAGITEIDPIEADLLFERFLTEGRDSLPDFDIDFPSTKRGLLQNHLRERWGDEYVVRVGTHLRLKSKGVVRKLASTLKSVSPVDFQDLESISQIIDLADADTSGLGRDWSELWEDYSSLELPTRNNFTLTTAREKYPLIFDRADQMVGRLHSYGKHAAGFVISTDTAIVTNTPLRVGEDDGLVTEFDMAALEPQGFVKFDMLTLRTLDTIQQTIDLIEERSGNRIDVYSWDDEYRDARVWDDLSEGHVLGVFQVEKQAGQKMCQRLQPQNIADLADVITLIRPGPVRSGLTEMYLSRRNGSEAVVFDHPDLSEALSRTYGAMIYQEDIMSVCSIIAGYDLNEADEVRRILGKKKLEKVQEEGSRFVARAVERGYGQAFAERLWEQMGEFARYSFNRAHAWAYALLGYWCAWFKVNYPVEFLTAILSTVPKERMPDFVREAKRLGIAVLPPDVNESRKGFTAADNAVRYGLDSVKGIADAAADSIIERQPYASWDEFRAWTQEKNCKANIKHIETLASVGAFDSLFPNRRALEMLLAYEKSGASEQCALRDDTVVGPNGLPCTFDWSTEPRPMSASGRLLKPKPIPKRCGKSCRQYVARSTPQMSEVKPYTAAEIRDKEREMLGVWLTSTPFDDLPKEMWQQLARDFKVYDAEDIEAARPGHYAFVGMLTKRRATTDRNGKRMAFLGFETPKGGYLDVACFSTSWERLHATMRENSIYAVSIEKTDRGQTLKEALSIL
jgi:DNA polymerase-3 subunit alpha